MRTDTQKAIEYFKDCQSELKEARERILTAAKDEGYPESLLNSDPRVARAYLEGLIEGRRRK
jgi:hypothetical protein